LILAILGIIGYSIRVDRPELNKIVSVLVLMRCYLPFFDIEERRHTNSETYNSIFFVGALNGVGIQ
jgi:hypothetical protein